MECIVNTRQGALRGKECSTYDGRRYYSFEGIPYAKPPVGDLRFRDPQPPNNWIGILDATKPGQKCAQMDPFGDNTVNGSEDCLYLNVYTPVLPAGTIEKLPVLFFVHGGRFLVGHGDYYQPDYLIKNDVVLVTINYRLHILGFLCLHIPECPGNASLKDTTMALRWVKSNIGFFNGDENNVTAIGESAGAGLVASYLTSNMADGLVHKVIAQSGSCLSDLYLIEEDPIEKAKQIALSLGQELNDVKSLYEFLMKAPVEDLVFATSMMEMSKPPYIINCIFLPVVEKKYGKNERFFEEYPLFVLKENRHKHLPLLLGVSSHEGALFLRKNEQGNIEYISDIERLLPRYLHLPYRGQKSIKIAQKLKDFYFGNKEIDATTTHEYLNIVSDAYFNRDIVMLAELYSKYSKNCYFYHFFYAGNMNTRIMKNLGIKGATHGDIIPYEFYRKKKADLVDKNDEKIVKYISEAWCSFARDGKPTSTTYPVDWRPYNRDTRLSLIIDEEISVKESPTWPRVKCWIDCMGERCKL